ncbi:MAG: haloacid dehalogenase [Phycisphaerae bacterium]|nr:MAG: haloacid dehalogenase [Phycisphaerae bacterium]
MQPIQAVIFDLDDTLYAEKSFTLSGYRAIASAYAKLLGDPQAIFQRMCELFDSPNRNRVFNVLLEEASQPDVNETVAKMIETFRNHTPVIELHPDADGALTNLRPKYKLGVISDGFLIAQRNKVAALQVSSRVDEVVLTDELGREFWKPHPKAFELIAEKLNVDHTTCIYVADNLAKDFVAPNALNWHTIHINRPDGIHSSNQPPEGGQPAHTIDSLDRLPALLTTLMP